MKYSANITFSGEGFRKQAKVELPELNHVWIESWLTFEKDGDGGSFALPHIVKQVLNVKIKDREFIPVNEAASGLNIVTLDWESELRVRLSNWFLQKTTYGPIDRIANAYCDINKVLREANEPVVPWSSIFDLFDLNAEFNLIHFQSVLAVFRIPHEFKNVQVEFK